MRALALALALALVSPPADACPAPRLVEVPLIADGGTLLDDGGLVIETRNGGSGAMLFGVSMMDGATALESEREEIAPGLSVLRPPRGDGRTITVIDPSTQVVLTLRQAKAKAAHAAPKVRAMTSTLPRGDARIVKDRRSGIVSSTAELTLAEAPAEDVLAIVVYRMTKGRPQGIAWWRPNTTELVYSYSTGGKGCVPGPVPVRQGERIAIGFVDINGRTSPRSKTLVVGAPRATKQP